MGTLLFDSMRNYDIPVVMGALLIIGVIALASRLLLEIVTAYYRSTLALCGTVQGIEPGAAEFLTKAFHRISIKFFILAQAHQEPRK